MSPHSFLFTEYDPQNGSAVVPSSFYVEHSDIHPDLLPKVTTLASQSLHLPVPQFTTYEASGDSLRYSEHRSVYGAFPPQRHSHNPNVSSSASADCGYMFTAPMQTELPPNFQYPNLVEGPVEMDWAPSDPAIHLEPAVEESPLRMWDTSCQQEKFQRPDYLLSNELGGVDDVNVLQNPHWTPLMPRTPVNSNDPFSFDPLSTVRPDSHFWNFKQDASMLAWDASMLVAETQLSTRPINSSEHGLVGQQPNAGQWPEPFNSAPGQCTPSYVDLMDASLMNAMYWPGSANSEVGSLIDGAFIPGQFEGYFPDMSRLRHEVPLPEGSNSISNTQPVPANDVSIEKGAAELLEDDDIPAVPVLTQQLRSPEGYRRQYRRCDRRIAARPGPKVAASKVTKPSRGNGMKSRHLSMHKSSSSGFVDASFFSLSEEGGQESFATAVRNQDQPDAYKSTVPELLPDVELHRQPSFAGGFEPAAPKQRSTQDVFSIPFNSGAMSAAHSFVDTVSWDWQLHPTPGAFDYRCKPTSSGLIGSLTLTLNSI